MFKPMRRSITTPIDHGPNTSLEPQGVRFAALKTSAWERATKALVFAAPFAYLGCVAWVVRRMQVSA
jgi:hypothetical protein